MNKYFVGTINFQRLYSVKYFYKFFLLLHLNADELKLSIYLIIVSVFSVYTVTRVSKLFAYEFIIYYI